MFSKWLSHNYHNGHLTPEEIKKNHHIHEHWLYSKMLISQQKEVKQFTRQITELQLRRGGGFPKHRYAFTNTVKQRAYLLWVVLQHNGCLHNVFFMDRTYINSCILLKRKGTQISHWPFRVERKQLSTQTPQHSNRNNIRCSTESTYWHFRRFKKFK